MFKGKGGRKAFNVRSSTLKSAPCVGLRMCNVEPKPHAQRAFARRQTVF